MKKAIYISIAVLIVGGIGLYLIFNQKDSVPVEEVQVKTIAPGEEMKWSAHFPEIIPEYTDGALRELSVGDERTASRFPNSASAIVDNTSSEEVQGYVDELVANGWLVTTENSQGEDYSSYQLSFEENILSISIGEGTLRLSTYTEPE